jgi:hypothetical protein
MIDRFISFFRSIWSGLIDFLTGSFLLRKLMCAAVHADEMMSGKEQHTSESHTQVAPENLRSRRASPVAPTRRVISIELFHQFTKRAPGDVDDARTRVMSTGAMEQPQSLT